MNPEQSEKPGLLSRAGNAFNEKVRKMELATSEMMKQTMIKKFLPYVKDAIPGIEKKLKNFLSGTANEDFPGDGREKMILMRLKPSGEVEIKILDAGLIELTSTATNHAEAKRAIIQTIKLDEYVTKFLQGQFDTVSEDLGEQV